MMFTSLLALFYGFLTIVKSDTTYCYNEDSCEDEDLSTSVCDCYGYYSCEGANITSTYAYDFGAYSNYDGHNDDEYIWSYGMLANYYSDVETYAMYNYGYLSAYEATIEALGSTLYTYFYGYYSGYHANVLCYSGDICRVYCGASYGCADLDFYCYSGAYCYYDCANDTDYCPTLYSGVASEVEYVTGLSEIEEAQKLKIYDQLTDEEIHAYHEKDMLISAKKRQTENIEQLVSQLTQITGKSGYADKIETPELQLNSLDDHRDRVLLKHKGITHNNNLNQWKNYAYAMIIDAALLFAIIGLYKLFSKKSNKDVVFANEDTPLVNNTNTVVL